MSYSHPNSGSSEVLLKLPNGNRHNIGHNNKSTKPYSIISFLIKGVTFFLVICSCYIFFYVEYVTQFHLPQNNRLFMMTSMNIRSTDHWLDKLYKALANDEMLTRNVKSKDRVWRQIRAPIVEGQALIYLGWVAYWNMEFNALNGGPAGEFVIFGDLITGLAALGYNITVVNSICEFWEVMTNGNINFNLIITDYDGLGTAGIIYIYYYVLLLNSTMH